MIGVLKYDGYKINKESVTKVVDSLTVEHALEIVINDKAFTVVMQTPGDEIDLAVGLLYAEDVISSMDHLEFKEEIDDYGFINRMLVKVPENELGDGYLSSRSLLSVSSCGICGKQSLEDLQIQKGKMANNATKISIESLFEMQTKMVNSQVNFKETGGCHGVAAFNMNGDLLAIKEDIGRHNAMDKVVGQLFRENKLKEAKVITFSGRVSYEIVSKAFRAKIPIIMAVSAPSTLAIDFAKEYGISILGFSRGGKTTCYSTGNNISF